MSPLLGMCIWRTTTYWGCESMFLCQKHFELFYLEDKYFSPPWSLQLDVFYFFCEKPFVIYFSYLRTKISEEGWINSINYIIKISKFLVFITFLKSLFQRSVKLVDATLQARDLIGSVARTEINPAGFNWSTQNGWLTTLIPDTHS